MSEEKQVSDAMFQVTLIKGASFKTPDGTSWRRNQMRQFVGGDQLRYYETNARFAIRGAPRVPNAAPATKKSRSVAREARTDRASDLRERRTQERIAAEREEGSKIESMALPANLTEEMIQCAQTVVVQSMKVDELNRIGVVIGATSPEGKSFNTAKNKAEKISWIRTRQAQILAQVNRGQDISLAEDDDYEPEDESDLEEDLDELLS